MVAVGVAVDPAERLADTARGRVGVEGHRVTGAGVQVSVAIDHGGNATSARS